LGEENKIEKNKNICIIISKGLKPSVYNFILFNLKIMLAEVKTKPSALNVSSLEDIIFLLRESEER
jgi:hypothetical protein